MGLLTPESQPQCRLTSSTAASKVLKGAAVEQRLAAQHHIRAHTFLCNLEPAHAPGWCEICVSITNASTQSGNHLSWTMERVPWAQQLPQ